MHIKGGFIKTVVNSSIYLALISKMPPRHVLRRYHDVEAYFCSSIYIYGFAIILPQFYEGTKILSEISQNLEKLSHLVMTSFEVANA